jgi:Phosphotransferase enzyme family
VFYLEFEMAGAGQIEHETYRVIVLRQNGTEVLVVPNGGRLMLPSVEVPRWQRVAENLTEAVRSEWGEEVVCLFEPAAQPPADDGVARYLAVEHLCTPSNSQIPTRWLPISALCQDSLVEVRDYAAIKQVTAMCNGSLDGVTAGPFAQFGWFRELRNWIESVIEPAGFHVNGDFRQLNASPTFSLVRFETSGPPVWFKAVGEPNQREFPITCLLAQYFPEYLPRILARRPDWNGWLTSEVRGKLLSDVQEQVLWEQAAAAFARLQIQSVDRGSQILGAGARDLGAAALSKHIQPFMSVVERLMGRQTKVPPPVLNRDDLVLLADSLQNGIGALEATGIPETLGHLDLNPGNIIVSADRCVFLDWAEAYVGNPFFSLEYLVQHARRAFGADSSVTKEMTRAYCAQWNDVFSHGVVAEAMAFVPLVAVFAYATGCDAWRSAELLEDPTTAGCLRTLARRMHREAKALGDRRMLCRQ